MFEFGWFLSHSKFQLPWKINCDSFSGADWADIAKLLQWKFAFGSVHGIPRGGLPLARACEPYITPGYPPLLVDDVLTTGASMVEARAKLLKETGYDPICFVVFNRNIDPMSKGIFVWSLFQVNQWSQSRATGLG